jgi:hypothetical protein
MDIEQLNEFRRAYGRWEDASGSRNGPVTVPAELLARLGDRMYDTMTATDKIMVCGSGKLDAWPSTVAACHDDSEECVHCAFPEHSPVVILLNGQPVCREHIWRALTTIGVRDRS